MQSQQPNADIDSSGWRPVYYASRKLTGPEARYAAIERQVLAVTWGLHRFRNFITGMPVVVLSDHKPLLQVFSPSYNLSAASLRIQRLVLKVQYLTFTVQFRASRFNHVADVLSRFPIEKADISFLICHAVSFPDGLSTAHRRELAKETPQDEVLCAVRDALRSDQWPASMTLAPFRSLRHELSVWPFPKTDDFVLLRGERLVIPDACVEEVLELAHDGHPGIPKTKARLQEAVWWPGWANMAKQHVKACRQCCLEATPPKVPLQP